MEVKKTCNDMVTVLAAGGFTLTKWNSNNPRAVPELGETGNSESTVLGVVWYEGEGFVHVSKEIWRRDGTNEGVDV